MINYKKNYFVLFRITLFTLFYSDGFAKILTVSNNPVIKAQYNQIQTAIDASTVGDTLYVHKSPTSYSAFNVTKKLTFIGSGHKPIIESNLTAAFEAVNLIGNASESTFIGVWFKGGIYTLSGDKQFNNLVFVKCRFTNIVYLDYSTLPSNNVLFESCVFAYLQIYMSRFDNVIFSNCIFSNSTDFRTGVSKTGIVFSNNLFLETPNPFLNLNNAIISNNIFYKSKLSTLTSFEGNQLNNNIIYNIENDVTIGGAALNTISNLITTDPQFKNFPIAASTGSYFSTLYQYDFFLDPTSPGINAGTDGKNIGLSDKIFSLYGTPSIPQITTFIIKNNVVNYGTPGDAVNMKVSVSGTK